MKLQVDLGSRFSWGSVMDGLLGIGEMARRLGVSVPTLRRWDKEGRLRPTSRTLGGHRRHGNTPRTEATRTVLYARVSCHDQKERLTAYADARGWVEREVTADLGSGLNFRKRGLLRLLDLIINREIGRQCP